MNYFFRGKNHPEANGRRPKAGEESFTLFFATEDGGKVDIALSREAFVSHAATIIRGLQDDPILNREVEDEAEQVEKTDFLDLDTRKKST